MSIGIQSGGEADHARQGTRCLYDRDPRTAPEGVAGIDWEVSSLRANVAAANIIWPLGETGLRKRLGRIAAPTLLVWGDPQHVGGGMLGVIVVAGFLAGLLPALRAYRLSVADGMTIKT